MSKPKTPPRLLDRHAIRLKGWTAKKIQEMQAKRKAKKAA